MLGEKKQRKLSLHDTELKSMSKQMRHKKDVSNFKWNDFITSLHIPILLFDINKQ